MTRAEIAHEQRTLAAWDLATRQRYLEEHRSGSSEWWLTPFQVRFEDYDRWLALEEDDDAPGGINNPF